MRLSDELRRALFDRLRKPSTAKNVADACANILFDVKVTFTPGTPPSLPQLVVSYEVTVQMDNTYILDMGLAVLYGITPDAQPAIDTVIQFDANQHVIHLVGAVVDTKFTTPVPATEGVAMVGVDVSVNGAPSIRCFHPVNFEIGRP